MSKKTLDPNLWTIFDVFERNIYEVPVYQRPYSWEIAQVNVLLDDIFEAFNLPELEKEEGYFVGSIYLHDKNEKLDGKFLRYDVIDGQQRLTTLALLLLSLYSIACQKGVEENNPTYVDIKRALWKYVDLSYKKENRTITLNSIEKKCFSDLYDSSFSNPKEILAFCSNYNPKSIFEKRVLENFETIYARINEQFKNKTKEDILKFAVFILNYVQVIAIDSTCSISKAFSIFESINSKGKILEDIDKIKTYIFSKLDEADYDFYLNLWGQLITETNNQLYDYLYNYIKAHITFYRQKINIDSFKHLCERELLEYFKAQNIADALGAFIVDLHAKVKYYNMLNNPEKAYQFVKNTEFRFYFTIFSQNNYQHPKALFLRCLEDFAEGKLDKDSLVDIVRETVKFMFEFLAIGDRESKDAITMFSAIMNEVYARPTISKDIVINIIANTLISKAVTPERIKSDLEKMDAYDANKRISVALLALYESTSINDNGEAKISYDKAYTLLNHYGQTFSLDHLLVQTPDPSDPNLKYYRDEKNDRLVLKEGHDFDSTITHGMDYDLFTRLVLNKIGNLRLWYQDENASRQNQAIQLNECEGFYTYKQVCARGKDIIKILVEKCLPMPNYNNKFKLYSDSVLPKMKKLIEYGLINIGDKIYLVNKPDNSEATLLDSTHVDYKGKKMTLNEWGCELTGWQSIRIYSYVAIVGEDETLQDKRKKYVIQQGQNDEIAE